MKELEKFAIWFIGLGGELKMIDITEISNKVNEPKFNVSTLKTRASEIKEKYNHKFNFKNGVLDNGI